MAKVATLSRLANTVLASCVLLRFGSKGKLVFSSSYTLPPSLPQTGLINL